MTLTINPCPFCRHADVEWCEPEPGMYAIDCPECQCIGPFADSENSAAQKWNAAGAQDRNRASIMTELCLQHEREIERLRGDAAKWQALAEAQTRLTEIAARRSDRDERLGMTPNAKVSGAGTASAGLPG